MALAPVYIPAFAGGELRSMLDATITSNFQGLLSNIGHLISTCEEIELFREEEKIPPMEDDSFFSIYLSLLLISNELDSAKYLWKRMNGRLRENSSEFFHVWEIGR